MVKFLKIDRSNRSTGGGIGTARIALLDIFKTYLWTDESTSGRHSRSQNKRQFEPTYAERVGIKESTVRSDHSP